MRDFKLHLEKMGKPTAPEQESILVCISFFIFYRSFKIACDDFSYWDTESHS